MNEESALIACAKAGDERAFEALVTAYEKKVYATAYRFDGDIPGGVVMVRGDEDAERFAVVAETNLAFAETAAHFSRVVSEVRYGVDIFEDKTGC